ncbi:MAG: ZIP family metal transporter [Candidatus Thorarchaeota archaeon]
MIIILLLIIFFSILGSIGAVLTAGIFLLFKKKIQVILVPCLIAYATGTLLAAALLVMIPTAISQGDPSMIMLFLLGGVLFFFLLEKTIIWHHCHDKNCEIQSAAGPLLLIGDSFHNFIDGIIIAAGFLISLPIGIIISFSVLTHEIPQEIGDFAILLESKYSKNKAFLLNLLSSSCTIPAAIISYYILDFVSSIVPFIIAISAASFIYIALTDLTPDLHHSVGLKYSIRQIILIFAGIGTITLIILI